MWRQRAPIFVAALWWGSLSALGAIVVPTLFVQLPTMAMAGQTAARLFSSQSWLGVTCGVLLLLLQRPPQNRHFSRWAKPDSHWVLAGMMLAMLLEWVIAPHIVAREDLRIWHSAGTLAFAVQWICAGLALWHVSASPKD